MQKSRELNIISETDYLENIKEVFNDPNKFRKIEPEENF